MKKKIINAAAILLAFLLSLTALSACSTDGGEATLTEEETQAKTDEPTLTPEATESGKQTSGTTAAAETQETAASGEETPSADIPTPTPSTPTPVPTPSTPTPVPPTPTPKPTLTPYVDPDFGPEPTGVAYLDLTESDLHKGDLLLIDAEHGFDPSKAAGMVNCFEQIRKKETSTGYLRLINTGLLSQPALVDALARLQHAMKVETGTEKDLVIRAAYMTAEEIEKARTDEKFGYCPGDDPMGSEHGAGLCANVAFIGGGLTYRVGDGGAVNESSYINANASRYGLIKRYTKVKSALTGHVEETAHFRYVGIPHAVFMDARSLCLEEYLDLLKTTTTPDERLLITDEDDNIWSVYYVPAQSGTTRVPVPEGVVYSVSGDNVGGFIVTVKAAWTGNLTETAAQTTPESTSAEQAE